MRKLNNYDRLKKCSTKLTWFQLETWFRRCPSKYVLTKSFKWCNAHWEGELSHKKQSAPNIKAFQKVKTHKQFAFSKHCPTLAHGQQRRSWWKLIIHSKTVLYKITRFFSVMRNRTIFCKNCASCDFTKESYPRVIKNYTIFYMNERMKKTGNSYRKSFP